MVFLPTPKYEGLLLRMGDYAFFLEWHNRYFMEICIFFYRLSSTIMVTIFVYNNFDWIWQANQMFERFKTPDLCLRLERIRKRCILGKAHQENQEKLSES